MKPYHKMCIRDSCYIHNISYEKADNMGFTPWFAKWNESIISENEYLSLTLFKRGGSERFPFVRNFFAYALVEDMSDAFTHGKEMCIRDSL